MKKRILIFVLVTSLAASLPSVAVAADPPLASCLSFGSETSSISSYAISISVPVYQKCGKLNRWGEFALITVDGDDGLLGAGKCTSFLLAQGSATLGSVYSGSINCTIVISGWQASKRVGQTSSTLRVKYIWDFSSTSVSVRHPAIPGSGSVGSGTSGGGSVVPSCLSAPSIPSLSYINLTDGIQFTATTQTSGEKSTGLFYSHSFYDESKSAWGVWSDWVSVAPSTTISYKAISGENKTYVAFAVYASNSCGKSAQARESIDKMGLLLPEVPASSDAVQEAIDAANAATDAANSAATTSSMNLVAAQSSLDIVAALSLQVDEIISSLKVQIAALSALILKIQAKMSR